MEISRTGENRGKPCRVCKKALYCSNKENDESECVHSIDLKRVNAITKKVGIFGIQLIHRYNHYDT